MKRLLLSVLMVLSCMPSLLYAGCGATNIVITNMTPNLCKLVKSELHHGYFELVSAAPAYIPPHMTALPIVLSVSFFGSELELSYKCGDNQSITISSTHDYRFFTAGAAHGQVIRSQNMAGELVVHDGSCLWSEHASMSWLLE